MGARSVVALACEALHVAPHRRWLASMQSRRASLGPIHSLDSSLEPIHLWSTNCVFPDIKGGLRGGILVGEQIAETV